MDQPGALTEVKPVATDGVRGIWHGQPGFEPYKYSGGLGSYPQQMNPMAVYDAVSDRTFFVFGARARASQDPVNAHSQRLC